MRISERDLLGCNRENPEFLGIIGDESCIFEYDPETKMPCLANDTLRNHRVKRRLACQSPESEQC